MTRLILALLLLLATALPAWAASDSVTVKEPDAAGGTLKKVDNESFARGSDTVYRQRVRVCGINDTDCLTPEDFGGGVKGFPVSIVHAVSVLGYNRSAEALIDAVNEEVKISGAGAGQITFEIPSGLTGTVVFETRMGTNAWESTPVVLKNGVPDPDGSITTFPAKGYFLETGYTEYRIRASAVTSGAVTPRLEVSLGAGLVRAVPWPRGQEWWEGNEYTTQQTDATFRAAPGANLALYVTSAQITCNAAGTIHLRDGTSGDFIAKIYCGAQGHNVSAPFPTPRRLTTNTALTVTSSGAFTFTAAADGFIAP